MTNVAHGFYTNCFSTAEQPRIWPGDEPNQQIGPDPAGKKGEGARIHAPHRARPPTPQGVCDAGGLVQAVGSLSWRLISGPVEVQWASPCLLKPRLLAVVWCLKTCTWVHTTWAAVPTGRSLDILCSFVRMLEGWNCGWCFFLHYSSLISEGKC